MRIKFKSLNRKSWQSTTNQIRWHARRANLHQLSSVLLCALLSACATTPKKYTPYQLDQGEWSGKVRIENKKDQSSHTVSLDFVAQRDRNLRMDVTTGLGIYLATFVLEGDQIHYLLARQRKYYSGPISSHALNPVLGVPLNPRLLQSLLFDTEPKSDDFRCQIDAHQLPSQCVSNDGQITVRWQKRDQDGSRTINIAAPRADLILYLSSARSNVQVSEKTFQIRVPEGFQRFELN